MNIFKIQSEYQQIVTQLIENGGELTPDLELAMQITKDNFHSKSESYGYCIREVNYNKEIIEKEIERLQKLNKSCDK
jgi:hypothetical protein